MTKEELEKEAEEKAKKRTKGFKCQDNCEKSYVMGALDFAEPREKRIAELEKENAELKEKWLQATDEGTSWAHLKSLERENAELKEQNKKLLESCEGATMMYEDLCKAKELLKQWVQYGHVNELLEQATLSFINSEVEKWHKVADGDLPKGDNGYDDGHSKTSIHRKIYLKDRDGNLYTGRYYPKDESHPEDCFAVEFLDWGLQGAHFCAKVQISEWCEVPV